VTRLAPDFIAAARTLAARRPGIRFLAPMADASVRELFERVLAGIGDGLQIRVLDRQARLALQAADAALVASGTASLEALLCDCPMVVAYRLSAATAFLVRALHLVKLPYFSLPNLLAGEALVPEFFQEMVSGERLAAALQAQLDDAPRRTMLSARFRAIHASLRQGGAASAAAAVLQLIGRS
jgi:lipid-A-disaccharide synthase